MFLHFHVSTASKSVASSPKVFTPRWHCQSHTGKLWVSPWSPKYFQLFQEELSALNDVRIDFHQTVSTEGRAPALHTWHVTWGCDKTITMGQCLLCQIFKASGKCLQQDLLQLHARTSHLALDAKVPCNNPFQTLEGSHCVLPKRKMEITEACLPQ